MRLKKSKAVDAIIQEAIAAGESAKDANYIRVTPKDDRSAVILTVHVNGKDGSWITYNPAQLDELVRQLQMFRSTLR